MTQFIPQGMGWRLDLPDARDYSYRHSSVLSLLRVLQPAQQQMLPAEVDLRSDCEGQYFTAPYNQGPLNCSAACAVLSLVEYFERRGCGRTFEGSKRFLYKVTRKYSHAAAAGIGDIGASLRTTLKTLIRFGVPPDEYWPLEFDRFDDEPSAFLYRLAKPFSEVCYFRLDKPNQGGATTLTNVKSFLAAGFPIAFGFPVPTSMTEDPDIPYRPQLDNVRGGQCAVAVGYNDNHFGRRQPALLIRSSWGTRWGSNGYGWLPCQYVNNQLARDFWTLVGQQWLDRREFEQPSVIAASQPPLA